VITLGERVYESAATGPYTLAYGLYMDQVLEDAGITAALSSLPDGADENARATAAKAAWRSLAQSGKGPELLAGLLKPVDQPWTPRWASHEATVLNAIDVREDSKTMTELLLVGLASFFNVGPRSSQISR
jgi:hypothetical protein